jgi:hypothetical protein
MTLNVEVLLRIANDAVGNVEMWQVTRLRQYPDGKVDFCIEERASVTARQLDRLRRGFSTTALEVLPAKNGLVIHVSNARVG